MKALVLAFAASLSLAGAAVAQSSTTPDSADITCETWNGLDEAARTAWVDTFSTSMQESVSTGATNADASTKLTNEQFMDAVMTGCAANTSATVNDVITEATVANDG